MVGKAEERKRFNSRKNIPKNFESIDKESKNLIKPATITVLTNIPIAPKLIYASLRKPLFALSTLPLKKS